ncbi:NADPH:quinone oxidoreductase family protein [Rhizobium sp. SG741]|uniref:quinone oxidoreductase family protein n=1 Tax=Rhizobium sp. SG741 TaxID=2587114 RepID=UPI001445F5F0|nr:NADPH:quinone oxidoreductase family protein [Rhizobium sp. SG741]NKJ09825.1 NADPH2:quinone reductase [Rhizobium sp. SG741]
MSPSQTMLSVRFHQTGGPDVLKVETLARPQPKADEVVVRVLAAGVNFADLVRRRGDHYPVPTPLPFNPGCEFAGVVESCGDGVDSARIGERVIGANITGGAYADYMTVDAASLMPWPDGLSPEQAAMLPIQGLTAFLALTDSGMLTPNDTVFVQGATGGVGSLIVRIAKALGARRIIAGVGNESKAGLAMAGGADAVIDYSKPDWTDAVRAANDGHGVDLVMDATSGRILEGAFDCLAPNGRAVVYGHAAPTPNPINVTKLLEGNLRVTGFFLGDYYRRQPEVVVAALKSFEPLFKSGRLDLAPAKVLPFAKAAEAHRLMEERNGGGKIILVPASRMEDRNG